MGKLLIAPVLLMIGYSYPAQAGYADLGGNITSKSYRADKSIYITSKSYRADESCYVTSKSYRADMTICLSGEIQEWHEQFN